MNIRNKYGIEENLNWFSLQPVKPLKNLSQWFLAGIFAAGILLALLGEILSEVMRYSIAVILICSVLHCLYDIMIRAKIRYTFDVRTNAVYRRIPFFSEKKIMKLDEAVIFVSSDSGGWYYSLGAKKSHFVKNYFISENFSSGKKSEQKQLEYEKQILIKIHKLIDAVQPLA